MYTPFDGPLQDMIKSGKLRVRYTKGYKKWKQKFDQAFRQTHDVKTALDKIHGEVPEPKED